MILNQLWSKCRLRTVFYKWVKMSPVIYEMESPDHTYNHTFLRISFWRLVDADCKKYRLVFNYSIEDSRKQNKKKKSDYSYILRAFYCIFTRYSSYTHLTVTIWRRHFNNNCLIIFAWPCRSWPRSNLHQKHPGSQNCGC